MARTIAVTSGKGGVGKSSIVSSLAYTLARTNRMVLAVDLDVNPGLSIDLGIPDADATGMELVKALKAGTPPQVIARNEYLHVIPGGPTLGILPKLEPLWEATGESSVLALRRCLAPLARDYDYILIDAAPGGIANTTLKLALGAADYCVIPAKADLASRMGITSVAPVIDEVRREGNPALHVLGVVLFEMPVASTLENKRAREATQALLGDAAPVFTSEIRYSRKAALRAREAGMPVLQYDLEVVAGARPWYEDPDASARIAPRAGDLAKDYVALTGEMLRTIDAYEADRLPTPHTAVAL